MNQIDQYFKDRDERMRSFHDSTYVKNGTRAFMANIHETQYVKNWSWMGVPILQLPTDMMAMQELIWKIQPDVIIETGVAFGGSLLFYASILEKVRIIGIDIDMRKHTREILQTHPLSGKITWIEGSSTDPETTGKVAALLTDMQPNGILVVLDSNHTHDHVLQELRLYSPLVSVGSYIVVFDTSIEWLDPKYIGDRPWGRGNSPYTAVQEFMKGNEEFVVDSDIEDRILLTSAVGGWLKRIK
jgi:cephalosporin hydroxylase